MYILHIFNSNPHVDCVIMINNTTASYDCFVGQGINGNIFAHQKDTFIKFCSAELILKSNIL